MRLPRSANGELRLSMSSRRFNALQHVAAAARPGTETVRVSVVELKALIADHMTALQAVEKRGVTIVEPR
jgi:hypothetical protein